MAAVLSDMYHKDGTHYDTGCLDVRNTLANLKIIRCETLSLFIKIFMYMQVGRLSGCNLKTPETPNTKI